MGSPFVNFLPFIYTTKWCCCKATLATVTQPHSGTPCKGYKAGSQSAEAQSCNCPLVLKSKLCIRNFVVWISMAAYLLQVQVAQYFCPYNVSYLNSKYTGASHVLIKLSTKVHYWSASCLRVELGIIWLTVFSSTGITGITLSLFMSVQVQHWRHHLINLLLKW